MALPISQSEFINVFSKSVYKKIIIETSMGYDEMISYSRYKKELIYIYELLCNNNYSPLSPRGSIMVPKNRYVARTIPVLHYQDESVYYFLCKMLEEDIAKNRVPNTFGGWRIGSPIIRKKEKDDIDYLMYCHNSYNPFMWTENWKEFVRISKSFVDSRLYKCVLKLDISNFYDSINLNILFDKLYKKVAKDRLWCLNHLSYFLKYWNKTIDGYLPRSIGLPQTEFGDQSRLLANFYLQDYDDAISTACKSVGAEYVRYADDQLIFFKDCLDNGIVALVNSELNKIGLNLNVGKCVCLSMNELSEYYLFEPLSLINEARYDESIKLFSQIYSKNDSVRVDTYLRRLLSKSVGFSKFNQQSLTVIKRYIFQEKFLLKCNCSHFKKIYDNINPSEQYLMVSVLTQMRKDVKFNGFILETQHFFNEIKI